MAATYSPEDEPYLGLQSLHDLDRMIYVVLEDQPSIAAYTSSHTLSPLQVAATQLIPSALSISLSTRELIRQAYLLSAQILLRPLLERCATLAYLIENPNAVDIWHRGWTWNERPNLKRRLAAMAPVETSVVLNNRRATVNDVDELVDHLNSLVHGDPHSALAGAIVRDDGSPGYSVGKDVGSPGRADLIAEEVYWRLSYLHVRTNQVFSGLNLLDSQVDG